MNSFDFDSGLDDLHVETSSSVFGRMVMAAMLIAFALASMVTTFSFFAVYAPRLGTVIHATYAPFVAGALGVLLFDLAGLGWTVLRARNSDTSLQFVIATTAAVATIGLALLVSALYVLLSSSFEVGLYDGAGRLTEFGQTMQIIGVVTMTLGFVLNFGAIAAYVNTSAGVSKAVQDTQLRAFVSSGRHKADKARAEMVTRRTLGHIMAQLPSLADLQGQANGTGYLDHSFTAPRSLPTGEERSSNGEAEARADLRAQIEAMRKHEDLDIFAHYPSLLEMAAAAAANPRPSNNGNGDAEDGGRPFRSAGRQND